MVLIAIFKRQMTKLFNFNTFRATSLFVNITFLYSTRFAPEYKLYLSNLIILRMLLVGIIYNHEIA